MSLSDVAIQHVRKISAAELTFHSGLNLVAGNNGSGKTSLLEAVYLLGLGKSFRTTRARELISHEAENLVVAGHILTAEHSIRVGVEKGIKPTKIKVGGNVAKSASELARQFPVLVMDAESYGLIDGGPAYRRALLDRTLFHVEPSYLDIWKRYHRALKHRNALLRQDAPRSLADFWHQELAQTALLIHEARLSCADGLNQALNSLDVSELI